MRERYVAAIHFHMVMDRPIMSYAAREPGVSVQFGVSAERYPGGCDPHIALDAIGDRHDAPAARKSS